MRWFGTVLIGAAILAAPFAWADIPNRAYDADIVLLGEVHDNPAHHRRQAEWVRALNPAALVFEMIPADVDPDTIVYARSDPESLSSVLSWEERGWPDFAMYYPIFTSAPNATIFGAEVSRSQARALMESPVARAFGTDAALFGLDIPLSEAEQSAREALQAQAHCGALPEKMLPIMVDVQRLRDATLAQIALQAYEPRRDQASSPVIVITGNGHARTDWGAPAMVARAAPDLTIFALGQTEGTQVPTGTFDTIRTAPAIDPPDPCAAFKRSN